MLILVNTHYTTVQRLFSEPNSFSWYSDESWIILCYKMKIRSSQSLSCPRHFRTPKSFNFHQTYQLVPMSKHLWLREFCSVLHNNFPWLWLSVSFAYYVLDSNFIYKCDISIKLCWSRSFRNICLIKIQENV